MSAEKVTRRGLTQGLTLVGALGLAGVAKAQGAPPQVTTENIARGRMTVPVVIDDQGPFIFVVDSAANASVIASDVAERLGLVSAGAVNMNTLIASERVQTVRARRLETGVLEVESPRLALAQRGGLGHIDGLLGTDLLAGHRLTMNFRGRTAIHIGRSRRSRTGFLDIREPTVKLIGSTSAGKLVLVQAIIGNTPTVAVIDTGAQVSIVNTAAADRAGLSPATLSDGASRALVRSPTGSSKEARIMSVPSLRIGGVSLGRNSVLVGDFHTFDLLGLRDTPAMLLGVDMLGIFQSVAVDFRRAELVFTI